MPTSCAPTGDCISARTLPSSVMRSNTINAAANTSASANTSSLLLRELGAAHLHRVGQGSRSRAGRRPQHLRSSAPGTSGQRDHQAARSKMSRLGLVSGAAEDVAIIQPSTISMAK